jgi:predicted GNAT family N-acyltransferase
MEILSYDYLPQEAFDIRVKVFMDEQGFVDEMDEIDSFATHFLVFYDGKAVATCRIFVRDGDYILGRFAVLKEYRQKGIGKSLLKFAEQKAMEFGAKCLLLHSQLRAIGFYEKCGYSTFGQVELEENYPHIWMQKSFN